MLIKGMMMRFLGTLALLIATAFNASAATELCEGKIFSPQINVGKASFDGVDYEIIKKGSDAAYSGVAMDLVKSGSRMASTFLVNDDATRWIRVIPISGTGDLVGDYFSTTLVASGFIGKTKGAEPPKTNVYRCEPQ